MGTIVWHVDRPRTAAEKRADAAERLAYLMAHYRAAATGKRLSGRSPR